MSLQERTLVVRNIDGDLLSQDLLEELFANFGPVKHIVLRKDHAFVEYGCKESVAYAWAMTEGIYLQDRKIRVAPRLEEDPFYHTFRDRLKSFERLMTTNQEYIDSFLNEEQLTEKKQLISELNSNASAPVISSLRRRLRQYERHYEAPSSFNLIVRRDLSNRSFERALTSSRHRSRSRSPVRRSQSSDSRHSGSDLRDKLNSRYNRSDQRLHQEHLHQHHRHSTDGQYSHRSRNSSPGKKRSNEFDTRRDRDRHDRYYR